TGIGTINAANLVNHWPVSSPNFTLSASPASLTITPFAMARAAQWRMLSFVDQDGPARLPEVHCRRNRGGQSCSGAPARSEPYVRNDRQADGRPRQTRGDDPDTQRERGWHAGMFQLCGCE